MLTTLTLASLLAAAAPSAGPIVCLDAGAPVTVTASEARRGASDTRATPSDDDLRELYQGGRSYTDFLGAATRRAELWHDNTAKSEVIDPALVARARAVGGTWRFLAVAIDSCSDSVNTIPYLARLVAMVDGLDMRIVDSTVGRAVMEAHRTPDGRAATPTVLLLDADYDEAGCFIERPPALRTWLLENDATLSSDELFAGKMAWYSDDAGHDTVENIVRMLEAAATGENVCG